jgi:DNA-binding response OmpR family regulator
MARIEALARRSGGFTETAASPEVLTSGALSFDTGSLEVRCGDTPINLTPKERDLVKLFLSSPRKIFSRERILSSLWGINQDPQTNVVDVYIGRLRKKLGPCGESIETVRGAGYRYAEDGRG